MTAKMIWKEISTVYGTTNVPESFKVHLSSCARIQIERLEPPTPQKKRKTRALTLSTSALSTERHLLIAIITCSGSSRDTRLLYFQFNLDPVFDPCLSAKIWIWWDSREKFYFHMHFCRYWPRKILPLYA